MISLTIVCAPKPTAKPTTPALAIMPSTLIPNLLKMVVITINQTIYLTTFCTSEINVFERFLLPFLLLF
ncbi:Uncharacterised protein [Streptococcus pneumoniae]|nr:Uncharacterised protein [Streptococcus pneumoniae]